MAPDSTGAREFGLGVDVFALAQSRGITILEEEPVRENIRGAALRKEDSWYILVNRYDSFERMCFTIAHEIAEIELDERDDLSLDEKHLRANIRAGEILLPDEIFKKSVYTSSLPELKSYFPACSFEVIARRILRFRQAVLTILDNGEITLRTATDQMNHPSLPTAFEMKIIKECYQLKSEIKRNYDNLSLEAYYIDLHSGIERVILFAFICDDFS